jgi:hypothetical protein
MSDKHFADADRDRLEGEVRAVSAEMQQRIAAVLWSCVAPVAAHALLEVFMDVSAALIRQDGRYVFSAVKMLDEVRVRLLEVDGELTPPGETRH